ncbi:hypothetical protein AAFX91_24310 [Bradyrhizobium sp. 31Argb]|uniref:hypothetical protein n=1 Tax=Bradyrhizobium sp. 31Argb TaxID=3141247 RepID=UPI00374832B4
MGRKKVASGGDASTKKGSTGDDSQRFLTVFLKKKRMVKGEFYICETLEKAKTENPPATDTKEEKKLDSTARGFGELQAQIIEQIGVHRSLDDIMIMLDGTNNDLQFHFSVRPALKRHAKLVHEDENRQVYSFDLVNAREVIASLRKAQSGLKGVRQLPKLILIGLIAEYDVFFARSHPDRIERQERDIGSNRSQP